MREAPAQTKASFKKREAQDRLIALVAQGSTIGDALKVVGRSRDALQLWRENEPRFRQRLEEVKRVKADPSGINFPEFRQLYFQRPTPAHHTWIITAIERARPDTITMILGYPGSAKTSLLVDRINYKLALDPNFRIAVVSEGQELARKIIGQVASRMVDEDEFSAYIRRYGPFKTPGREQSKTWNQDSLRVQLSNHDEKEPSLEARGAKSRIYGGRYDELVLDDVQSDVNLNLTSQLMLYIRQTVLTRPAKGVGKTFFLGSRVGEGDVYSKMIDEDMVDEIVTVPALDRPVTKAEHYEVHRRRDGTKRFVVNPDCPAKSTWPEYWDLESLAARRDKVGEEIWARTYMQQEVVAAGATFTAPIIEKVLDRSRGLGRSGLGLDVICTVDPAFDSGVAAFMAIAVSANRMWVIDALERTDIHRYEDIYAQIAGWSATYRPSHWIVEQNNFQRGLHQDDRMREMESRFGFSCIGHQTHRNKNDSVLGVAMMASAFLEDEISLPYGDDDATAAITPLTDELRTWRPKASGARLKQDSVLALWFGWLWWSSWRQTVTTPSQQLWRPSWMAQREPPSRVRVA